MKTRIAMHAPGTSRAEKRRKPSLGLALQPGEKVVGVYAREEKVVIVIYNAAEIRLIRLSSDRLPPNLRPLIEAKHSFDEFFRREIETIVRYIS